MRQISIEEIMEGDIIAESIYNSSGALLIAEDSTVKSKFFLEKMLKQHEVKFIKIKNLGRQGEIEKTDGEPLREPPKYAERVKTTITVNKDIMEEEFTNLVTGKEMNESKLMGTIVSTINTFKENMEAFTALQEIKYIDDSLFTHLQNVSFISYMIGNWMGIKGDNLDNLLLVGLFADIGKLKIKSEIINKKGELTPSELLEVQKHPIYSIEIMKELNIEDQRIIQGALLHHERFDRSGYPFSNAWDKIPIEAQIVSVADVYTALTSDRPHRPRYTPFEALNIMRIDLANELPTDVNILFLQRILDHYIGSNVELTSGEQAKIVNISKTSSNPIVQLMDGEIMDLSNSVIKVAKFV